MKIIFLSIVLTLSGKFTAQQMIPSELSRKEDSLAFLLHTLRSLVKDKEKDSLNAVFKVELRKALSLPEGFTYPFSKLKSVGFVDSPDGEVRIVNWNIEQEDQSQKYTCFVMKKNKKGISITEFIENAALPSRPDGVLEASNWYGALYYKIIPKAKGSKKMYVLLGWDGNNSSSTIKLIDALYFAGSQPKLGSPVFRLNNTSVRRIFFEYAKKATIALKYEPEHDRIIYDHLSPETPSLAGIYSFYVPDLSYDALYFKDNKWVLKEDVIAVNQPDGDHKEVYIKNERTGKIEKVEIKDKWQSPEDARAPLKQGVHKAVLPDALPEEEQTQQTSPELKVNKRDKRDPRSLNTTVGSGPSRRKHRNN